jgi:hypothetical protein
MSASKVTETGSVRNTEVSLASGSSATIAGAGFELGDGPLEAPLQAQRAIAAKSTRG